MDPSLLRVRLERTVGPGSLPETGGKAQTDHEFGRALN